MQTSEKPGTFSAMRISDEGKIGIGLALLFGIGAGAAVIWPDHKIIGWATMGFSSFGLMILLLNHFFTVERRSQKEFTSKTIDELFDVYIGHTDLRGDMLFEHYVGLWITVSGVPSIMKKHGSYIFVSLIPEQKGKVYVHFTLSRRYEKALARLEVDEPITVTGQIKGASKGFWLKLEKCELISTGLPTSRPVIPAPQQPLIETLPQTFPD